MKKLFISLLSILLIFSLTACSLGSNKATVTTNSGEVKEMTFDEIKDLPDENQPLFTEEYCGATVEFTGKISSVGGAYLLRSWFEVDAYLEIESSSSGPGVWFVEIPRSEASNYNVGDTVYVKGKLAMATVASFNICILEDDNVMPFVSVQ